MNANRIWLSVTTEQTVITLMAHISVFVKQVFIEMDFSVQVRLLHRLFLINMWESNPITCTKFTLIRICRIYAFNILEKRKVQEFNQFMAIH